MMRYQFLGFLCLIVVGSCALAQPSTPGFVVQYESCYDGDTCRVTIPGILPVFGLKIPVRFRGIDTPEIRGECLVEKQLAVKVRDLVRERLREAETIYLSHISRGKYFRLVGVLTVDGVDLSQLLLDSGLAVPYDGGKKVSPWCG